MSPAPPQKISFVALVLLMALGGVWGGSFFFAEIALREVSPLAVTFHRVSWAALFLLIVIWRKGMAVPRGLKHWACYLVMGVLNNVLPFSLIFWGQTTLESGTTAILNSTTAVFGAVIAAIFLADERLTFGKSLGAVFGMLGVAVMMGIDSMLGLELRSLAQIAIIGAAISYSVASVWAKKFLSGHPPVMNAFCMLLSSMLVMVPVLIVAEGSPRFDLSIPVWSALLALSVFSTGIAYILYFEILKRAGAANLMLVTLIIPPVAVVLGSVFLGERLGIQAFAGFLLIAIGLAITDGRLFVTVSNRRMG
jgi:drug/metabolite transporter (DMT)-like permease